METVVKRNITVIAFFIVLILAGVGGPLLSNLMSKEAATGPEPITYQYTGYYNDSYQYNGIMGMGHSTNETINMTHMGSLNVTMDIVAHFHDPLIGEQGYFNISLWDNDTLLYTNQTTENVVWNYFGSLAGTNLTIVVQSVGSDGTLTGSPVADYYILELTATVEWVAIE